MNAIWSSRKNSIFQLSWLFSRQEMSRHSDSQEKESSLTRRSSTVLRALRRKRKSPLGWKNAGLANGQSITNCATGYSRVNDIGASPFQFFGKTANIADCRKKNCQSF